MNRLVEERCSPTRRTLRSVGFAALGVTVAAAALLSGGPASADEKGSFSLRAGDTKSTTTPGKMLDGTATANFTVPALTGSLYLAVPLRSASNTDSYRARVVISKAGYMSTNIVRLRGGKTTTLTSGSIPGKVKAGQTVRLQGRVTGISPVKVQVRAWINGQSTPGWQRQHLDSSSGRVTASGYTGAVAYLSKAATRAVRVNFSGVSRQVETPPVQVVAPETKLTAGPADGSSQYRTSTDFSFSSSTAGAKFECSLDASAFAACSSPSSLTGLSTGQHAFKVRAVVSGVSDASPATSNFAVKGKPTAETTGVPAGTKLTRHDGNIIVTKDGTHLDGMDIHGFVTVRAKDVKITNSVVRGGPITYNNGLITNYGHENLLIENVDLVSRTPSVWTDGIKGSNFTARRVHIIGNVDSVKIQGDDVTVQDSLLENTTYYASDPSQGGGPTHNDNIQIQKGKNISIVGNTIRGSQNFAILGAATIGDTPGLMIAENWLDGGHCTVKLQALNGYLQTTSMLNNKFGPNRAVSYCAIQVAPAATLLSESGNVSEADGSPVPIYRKN